MYTSAKASEHASLLWYREVENVYYTIVSSVDEQEPQCVHVDGLTVGVDGRADM